MSRAHTFLHFFPSDAAKPLYLEGYAILDALAKQAVTIEDGDTIRVVVRPDSATWDICKPTSEIHENPLDAEACRLLGLVGLWRGPLWYNKPCVFLHGPTAQERRRMWGLDFKYDEMPMEGHKARRQRLVDHLVKIPGVLVGMTTEPMMPWKGMKLFHGTSYEDLQRIGTECNLSWGVIEGSGVEGVYANTTLSAFTTPYFTKALNYGSKIYTYRLKKEGRDLKLIDLRSDYHAKSRGTELDPFRWVSELSGISYINSLDRTFQAGQLFELFRDTDVDGAILNTDIEWIWFKPKEVLEWEGPGEPGSLTNQLLDGSRTEDGRSEATLASALDDVDEVLMSHQKVKAMLAVCPFTIQRVADIPHLRWSLDKSPQPYVNQYLATSSSVSPLWRPVEIQDHTKAVKMYEVDYRKLWHILAGSTDRYQDLYMASSITEGAFNHLLPYNRLVTAIQMIDHPSMPIHIKVTLPTGAVQIVPPIPLPQEDYVNLPRTLERLERKNRIQEASARGRGPSATLRGEKRSEAPALEDPRELQKARLQARMRLSNSTRY